MRALQVLGRVLGLTLLARVAQRMPGPLAWWASLAVLVVANLLPVLAVARGAAGIGDVFLVYWIENVVVWATSIVRVATAEGGPSDGPRGMAELRRLGASSSVGFFALHYGIFTLVHGVFTVVIVALTGLTGGVWPVVVLAVAITAGHVVSLGLVWFGRGERRVVSPRTAMWTPYPRMFVMHLAVIGGFAVALGPEGDGRLAEATSEQAAVALLCGLKLLVDVGFHLLLLRRARLVEDGDGLYGPATA